MPGIIVGVDGSGHSQRALEWAMKEAAIRHLPLSVLTVHPAIVGYYGGVVTSSQDLELTQQAEAAVKAEGPKRIHIVMLRDATAQQVTDGLFNALARNNTPEDVAAQKATYPSILGLDGAKAEARRLTSEAHAALKGFGVRGERLRQLADHLLERDF